MVLVMRRLDVYARTQQWHVSGEITHGASHDWVLQRRLHLNKVVNRGVYCRAVLHRKLAWFDIVEQKVPWRRSIAS